MMLENCVNDGNISGMYNFGGFIGTIENVVRVHVIFSEGINNGNITGNGYAGGCIGVLQGSDGADVIVQSFTNNGIIKGDSTFGGLFGSILLNENTKVSISNAINNGKVTGDSYLGGIIGDVEDNTNFNLNLFNVTNNGIIHGKEKTAGGLIGDVYDNINATVYISKSFNNGLINSSDLAAGLFGRAYSSDRDDYNLTLVITNSMNKGDVLANEGMSCGLFCVDPTNHKDIKTTVLNSANKGSIFGTTNASGIANNITNAINVVSMGKVNGTSKTFSFWSAVLNVNSFYGLKTICSNCDMNGTAFELNSQTGFYEVVGTGAHVDELLNDKVSEENYEMYWTSKLELYETVASLSSASTCFLSFILFSVFIFALFY